MTEFRREIRLDTLGAGTRALSIEATTEERDALTARFGLVSVERLTAEAEIHRDGETVFATGQMHAGVTQSCVATGEPVTAAIDEPFTLRFVPVAVLDAEGEVELGATELDTVGYIGSAVDLGEAVAETLGVALDPFPRSPHADEVLARAGVLRPEDVGPFAALKGLKDKLKT